LAGDVDQTDDGVEVFMDAAAHGADAVMIVGRVKWHTTFDGWLESGLMKMMAIGLGKFAGAQKYHTHAQRLGLEHVIRTAGRRVLRSGR
jgi:peptidyl-tRNA hydrolase